jgi:hypothetical protein
MCEKAGRPTSGGQISLSRYLEVPIRAANPPSHLDEDLPAILSGGHFRAPCKEDNITATPVH